MRPEEDPPRQWARPMRHHAPREVLIELGGGERGDGADDAGRMSSTAAQQRVAGTLLPFRYVITHSTAAYGSEDATAVAP